MGSKRNVASGNDRVAIQVGQVTGRHDTGKTPEDTSTTNTGPVRTENTCTGNATVGRQADEIRGGLTFGR
ncbi:hypothetical protein V6U90_32910 [Micromonospora sp. CPCC 206060]|uniref:hypothetical protein n=1 Tax=Micromonospora sp. CPCC 206060 TaxID=3122406 RepID=UPI002FEEB472